MNKFGSNIQIPKKSARSQLKPEIIWGCDGGGSAHFPRNFETINARKHSPNPQPMRAFQQAVREAQDRVWVVDDYFLVPDKDRSSARRVETILDWLHDDLVASDIRILTKKHDQITEKTLQLFQEREDSINSNQVRRTKKCSIQVSTHLRKKFDYVHDRFAIVDDELWHFGATVGGFHTSINAASRGWCAAESSAIEFFEMVWSRCKVK